KAIATAAFSLSHLASGVGGLPRVESSPSPLAARRVADDHDTSNGVADVGRSGAGRKAVRSGGPGPDRCSPKRPAHPGGAGPDSGSGWIRRSQRSVQAHAGVIVRVPGARVVPRREVRHLGALGAAMPARNGRLVRAADVSVRFAGLSIPPAEVRAPVEVRLQ